MSKYTPNWNDPRVVSRATKAIQAITRYLHSEDDQCEFDRNWLNKNLGNSNKPLGRYLRSHLLKCKSHYYTKKLRISKTYELRLTGVNKILDELKLPAFNQYIRASVKEQYSNEFLTGKFNYTEIKDRYFHPLQFIERAERYELFNEAGYRYHYDIQCCAPTLIYQAAMKCGMKPQPVITRYLADRKKFRDHISATYNIDPKIIKTMLTGIFTGAQLGCNTRSRLYQLLSNWTKMRALSSDADIIAIKKEITKCWVWIRKFNTLKCNGTDKSMFYRQEEKLVLNSIKRYATSTHAREFSIHDGWITTSPMDLVQLTRHIFNTTGYNVIIDCDSDVRDDSPASAHAEPTQTHTSWDKPTRVSTSLSSASPTQQSTTERDDRDISECVMLPLLCVADLH